MDKSSDYIYKSKKQLFLLLKPNHNRFVTYCSYTDWGCRRGQDLFVESIFEELVAEDSENYNWGRICDKKRNHEGWCNSEGAIVGYRRTRKV